MLAVSTPDGWKPGSSLDEPLHAANQQAGRDEQHDREGDLGCHQNPAGIAAACTARCASHPGLERGVQIGPGEKQCRHHAEDHRRRERRGSRQTPALWR